MTSAVSNNLGLLFAIWTQRQTGRLHLRARGATGASESSIEVRQGGLVRAGDWDALLQAVQQGELMAQLWPTSGEGDRRSLGALLSVASRRFGVALGEGDRAQKAEQRPTACDTCDIEHASAEEADQFVGGHPDRQEALLREGRDAFKAGQVERAEAALREARDLRFDHPEVLACLACVKAHRCSGDRAQHHQDARQLIRLAEQLAPESGPVHNAMRALKDLLASPAPCPPQPVAQGVDFASAAV